MRANYLIATIRDKHVLARTHTPQRLPGAGPTENNQRAEVVEGSDSIYQGACARVAHIVSCVASARPCSSIAANAKGEWESDSISARDKAQTKERTKERG